MNSTVIGGAMLPHAPQFFTMPATDLVDEVAPFVLQVDDFDIPPHSTGVVGSTCPVFGGPALDRLFVTTARKQCEHEPLAGALFELDPQGHRGLAPHRFQIT